jgi:hypothetical protein
MNNVITRPCGALHLKRDDNEKIFSMSTEQKGKIFLICVVN